MSIEKYVADSVWSTYNQPLFISKTFQIKQNIQSKYCLKHCKVAFCSYMNQVSGCIIVKPGLIQGNKRLPFTEKIEQKSNKFEKFIPLFLVWAPATSFHTK